jgi:hypothetical protein
VNRRSVPPTAPPNGTAERTRRRRGPFLPLFLGLIPPAFLISRCTNSSNPTVPASGPATNTSSSTFSYAAAASQPIPAGARPWPARSRLVAPTTGGT